MTLSIIYAIGCALLWAGTTVAGKMLTGTMPALSFAFIRYTISTLCFLPFLSYTEFKQVKVRHIPAILSLGFFMVFLFNILFFTALSYAPATTVSLISSINPIVTLFILSLVLRRLPKKAQLLAFMLSFAGTAMIITKGRISYDILTGSIGEFLMIASVFMQIAYAMTMKKISAHFSPLFLSFATGVSGLLFILPFICNKEFITSFNSLGSHQWMLLCYVGTLGTAAGMLFYSMGIKRAGPATTNLIVFSTMPVFVGIFSFFLLGEHLTQWHIIGGTLVISALIIGLRNH